MSVRTWRGRRVDANHAAIVEAFRAHGWSVQSLAAIGKGCPDLVVGRNGINLLVEVKTITGKFKPDQVEWCDAWRGTVCVVCADYDVDGLTAQVNGLTLPKYGGRWRV